MSIQLCYFQVTIVKICGKKTPLVHYKIRSEKQYKSDHENFIVFVSNDKLTSPSSGGNSVHSPNERNIESRTKRSRKNTSRRNSASKRTSSANFDQNRENNMVTEFERATTLASKLAVKLVVSLPPESVNTSDEKNGRMKKEKGEQVERLNQ